MILRGEGRERKGEESREGWEGGEEQKREKGMGEMGRDGRREEHRGVDSLVPMLLV